MPDYDGPVVFVQGDTGPGNFMYENGKVTAVVDWELAHYGDPMDDIAWLSLRTVQDTFTHFPDRLREYEKLSGNTIDAQRVWYYRLFAETRLTSNSAGAGGLGAAPREGQPVARDIGNGIIYGMLHRRLTIEALAAAMGFELPAVELPEEPPPEPWHAYYDATLDNLQIIVPRIEDQLASQWTKGVARILKYLKEVDRSGRAFADAELDDIAELLGHTPESLVDGRRELSRAASEGTSATRSTCGTCGARCSATTTSRAPRRARSASAPGRRSCSAVRPAPDVSTMMSETRLTEPGKRKSTCNSKT